MNQRELFFRHVAQTSDAPIALEIVRAEGTKLFSKSGKEYLDMIGGISVSNIGHRHPAVVSAIKEQADRYLHILVYGELIQAPQVELATLLASNLPENLDAVYFTNSGAEAVEGAMKLAKRATNRSGIVAFNNSYHGSTQGALSIIGDEYWRNTFRPLLPGITHLEFNSLSSLDLITTETACVIVEVVQAENGVRVPENGWLTALYNRCKKTGALLILDEIQTGFGRTGTLWAFEQYKIEPDILLLGKALGGGMPIGAFIASKDLMNCLSSNPVLGHITTFGGHPVSCAAGKAAMEILLTEKLYEGVEKRAQIFSTRLMHPLIKDVRCAGLLIAIEFEGFDLNKRVIDQCIARGLLTDWFLFAQHCMRIAPSLLISKEEIHFACDIILSVLDEIRNISM